MAMAAGACCRTHRTTLKSPNIIVVKLLAHLTCLLFLIVTGSGAARGGILARPDAAAQLTVQSYWRNLGPGWGGGAVAGEAPAGGSGGAGWGSGAGGPGWTPGDLTWAVPSSSRNGPAGGSQLLQQQPSVGMDGIVMSDESVEQQVGWVVSLSSFTSSLKNGKQAFIKLP